MASGRATGFLALNALANAGGVIAFLPLLSLMLPVKIEAIAGEDRLALLTVTVIAGAFAASGSNLLFGWLSDRAVARGGGRRGWAMAGLAGTVLSFGGVVLASSPGAIVAAIAFFQFAVNALLAPMQAIMADEIPDDRKRTAGGLLSLGMPLAAGLSALLVAASLSEAARLGVVALVVTACVAPLLATRAHAFAAQGPTPERQLRADLAIAWGSRLLVQIAGAVMSYYLIYYFESVVPGAEPAMLAWRASGLLLACYVAQLPVAVLVGRWSDASGRGKPFLLGAALLAALGLAGMAAAWDWNSGAVAFACFSIGSSVFLSLHSGFAMQLLPDPAHRGRDLGLLNLTNTLPQLLGPAVMWWLATPHDFGLAVLVLAGLMACGAGSILGVRGRR